MFRGWKFICRYYCKYKSYISNPINLVKKDLNSNWLFCFRLCCSFMFLHSLKCLYSCASVGSEHQCITVRNQMYILVWIENVCLRQCNRLKNSSDWKYAFLFLHCDTVSVFVWILFSQWHWAAEEGTRWTGQCSWKTLLSTRKK